MDNWLSKKNISNKPQKERREREEQKLEQKMHEKNGRFINQTISIMT